MVTCAWTGLEESRASTKAAPAIEPGHGSLDIHSSVIGCLRILRWESITRTGHHPGRCRFRPGWRPDHMLAPDPPPLTLVLLCKVHFSGPESRLILADLGPCSSENRSLSPRFSGFSRGHVLSKLCMTKFGLVGVSSGEGGRRACRGVPGPRVRDRAGDNPPAGVREKCVQFRPVFGEITGTGIGLDPIAGPREAKSTWRESSRCDVWVRLGECDPGRDSMGLGSSWSCGRGERSGSSGKFGEEVGWLRLGVSLGLNFETMVGGSIGFVLERGAFDRLATGAGRGDNVASSRSTPATSLPVPKRRPT